MTVWDASGGGLGLEAAVVIGADVQDGLLEIDISCFQPSDLCQAGSSVSQENK